MSTSYFACINDLRYFLEASHKTAVVIKAVQHDTKFRVYHRFFQVAAESALLAVIEIQGWSSNDN